MINVSKYLIKENFILAGKLLLRDEEIYIQNYDKKNKHQLVFLDDKVFLTAIEEDLFMELESKLVIIEDQKGNVN